jgi:hypothetical protein
MTRRAHPYFSQVSRRPDAAASEKRRSNARAPLASANDEPGVLWQAFRDDHPAA